MEQLELVQLEQLLLQEQQASSDHQELRLSQQELYSSRIVHQSYKYHALLYEEIKRHLSARKHQYPHYLKYLLHHHGKLNEHHQNHIYNDPHLTIHKV